jgi:broad specificity phosphatase PhoE
MGYLNMGFLPPHGESTNMVERRVSEWLEKDILYFEYRGQNINKALDKEHLDIVCFSHGMTIKCLLHYVMGFDKSFLWKIEIDNTSVTKLSFGKQGWKLNYINDTSHLR